ncbi:MAG: ligase-associated DNA damage response DEXH box helicase [Neomegalonema sp.]|nr:ligase-associated DNA damage response DEXH box helicase [Neomegalonema sp.]
MTSASANMAAALPPFLADWFSRQGWTPHAHQLDLLRHAASRRADLLIAPTGGGKTLAGFLPSLAELGVEPRAGLHTLYVSPLKALATDIRRNLEQPIEEMALPIRVEDRTGDTKQSVKSRQRADPPHFLLTTPESLALLLSHPTAARMFRGLRAVIVDELHALAGTKRGDQLSLCLARLRTLAPSHRRVGLSATTEAPDALARWLDPAECRLTFAPPGPEPDIAILESAGDPPWSGMGGRYAAPAVLAEIAKARTTIVFINTRAQAELFFRALWAVNDANLPIALHHGSLSIEARLKVEAAMAQGKLRAVVATSSLDLGVDWADVDLVIQVGAPKGVKRLVQRIGRANHRFDAPSRALLTPANRFELLECRAALEAAKAGELDGEGLAPGGLDMLCQHICLTACANAFDADALFAEVRGAGAYADLTRADFDRCLAFCADGGYALRAYDQWRRLLQGPDGLWRLRDPRSAQRLRMNVGGIVESEKMRVRLGKRGGGASLGEVEESFAATLRPGDAFLIGGQVVRFEQIRELSVEVAHATGREPRIPVFAGGKLPISTFLAHRVLEILETPARWSELPASVSEWLELQQAVSALPSRDSLLVETFQRGDKAFLAAYGFAGRNAHQTLGLLLSKRLEEADAAPLGFVANDYALMLWSLELIEDPAPLFERRGLREGLDAWLSGSAVMKRTFRQAAVIAGLIERRLPGAQKSGRQTTVSSDILYDTLTKYDPDHLLLDVTRREAMRGLIDFGRIEEMLGRIAGGAGGELRLEHRPLPRMSPLAAPLMLEMGRVPIQGGSAEELLLEEEARRLIIEAAQTPPSPNS